MKASAEKTTKTTTMIHRNTVDQTFFGPVHAGRTQSLQRTANTFFQPKLSVSEPGDKYEREADTTAETVMRMPDHKAINPNPHESIQRKEEEQQEEQIQPQRVMPMISRMADEEKKEDETVQTKASGIVQRAETADKEEKEKEEETSVQTSRAQPYSTLHRSDVLRQSGRGPPSVSPGFESTLQQQAHSGEPLASAPRSFMESRFGADFSGVRVHTDSTASAMSSSIGAHAFTHQNHIYFNTGKYDPDTSGGRLLLAHELTHTIQQGATPLQQVQRHLAYTPLPGRSVRSSPVTALQRAEASGSVDLTTLSGGVALPSGAREFLENQFEVSVSDIRAFTSADANALCKAQGKKFVVQNERIALSSESLLEENEQAADILSQAAEQSLKQQRRISDTQLTAQRPIAELIAEAKTDEVAKPEPSPGREEASKEDKEKKTDKSGQLSKEKPAKDKTKKEGAKKRRKVRPLKTELTYKKSPPGRSPASPQEDKQFLNVINRGKQKAKAQREHEDAGKKSQDAQAAAKAVPNEAESKAQERKTDTMEGAAQQESVFDEASFKKDLLAKIESITPKNLKEADNFKNNNGIGEVKNAMGEKVGDEKAKNTDPVDQANAAPLQVNPADNKADTPLPPTPAGPKPGGIGASAAVPKPKTEGEISMQEQSQSLDDEMKQNNVTEEQLANSNEPSFTKALDEKQTAQKDALEKPQQFKKEEAGALKESKAEAQKETSSDLAAMHNARGKNFGAAVSKQQLAKQKDEQERQAVVLRIEGMYKSTEETVNKHLTEAETKANEAFDSGSETARLSFENHVDNEMRAYKRKRYSGFWGGLRWAKDKLFGMPDAVNRFYAAGRKLYLEKMDDVITKVARIVTINLKAAKTAIKNGKQQIADYVKTLKGSLKTVGKEAAAAIQEKFEALEESVDDKRNQLIDGLAQKYVDNLKKLDARIEELKEANKGLVSKAIGFLKEVYKVIKNLKELFQTILSRIAEAIGAIIAAPGRFFSNLGKAFGDGFSMFENNLTTHLENGLMIWISSQLGVAGITIPEKFDLPSLFGLALQVLGISKENIRARAVVLFGEKKVKIMEGVADVFIRIKNEGLGGLWEMLKEKFTDLKDMVWEAIISFIKSSIVKAAFTFLLSLLNPIAAFIKACIAIYDFIMFLVRMKDQIIDFINSVLDAVMMIANGAVGTAATAVEKALAKSIPIIIGFLAALLRINPGPTLRKLINKIQKRVEKAIDWVLQKAYNLARPAIEAAMRVYDKGEAMVEKGKEKVIETAGKIGSWFKRLVGLEKKFKSEDGAVHRLYFTASGQQVTLMLNPDPANEYLKWVQSVDVDEKAPGGAAKKAKKTKAIEVAKEIDKEKAIEVKGKNAQEKEAAEDAKIKRIRDLIDELSGLTGHLFTGQKPDCSIEGKGLSFQSEKFGLYGSKMVAQTLTNIKMPAGSVPSVSHKSEFAILNQRRKGNGSYYVLGHLLNHNLGGTGKEWKNLTPLTREANKAHEQIAEARVKNAVTSGNIVQYEVEAVYGRGAAKSTDKKIQEIMNEETKVPKHLVCSAEMITPPEVSSTGKEKRLPIVPTGTIIKNDVSQETDAYDLVGIKLEPVYLDSGNEDKIKTIEKVDAILARKIVDAYKDKEKSQGTRFGSLESLAQYVFSDGVKQFTERQKDIIMDFSDLEHVKLFKV